MRLWLDEWEMACCGDTVRIGEEVTFPVAEPGAPRWPGCDTAAMGGTDGQIVLHDGVPGGSATREVRGRVTSLWEVRRGAPRSDGRSPGLELTFVDVIARASWDADPEEASVVPPGWIIEIDPWT